MVSISPVDNAVLPVIGSWPSPGVLLPGCISPFRVTVVPSIKLADGIPAGVTNGPIAVVKVAVPLERI